jgi:hypothetical protein
MECKGRSKKGKLGKVSMHPVLKSALEPLATQICRLSLEEAQVPPLPGQARWCAQQIIEHLILTYNFTSAALTRQLESGRAPKNHRSILQFVLRVQTIGTGYMPSGIPSMRSVRPTDFVAENGQVISKRFLRAAEDMDVLLVAARKKFGIQACGEHPQFGLMRVDEWRRYHAIHGVHHTLQLKAAIRYARTQQASST